MIELSAHGVSHVRIPVYGWSDNTGSCDYDTHFRYQGRDYHGNMVIDARITLLKDEAVFNIQQETLVSNG